MTTTTTEPTASEVSINFSPADAATFTATVNSSAWEVSSPRSWYAISNGADNEAEIRIYEDIGAFGVSAKSFSDDLEAIQAKTIHVRLNTDGGDVFDGIAIGNAIKAHPAKVVIHVDGLAASAGSVIAMSGDEIRMADNAFLMIHEARGGVMGEAGDMRQVADVLDKINDVIASTYQARAGKSRKYWRTKMADESWFTAAEAKAEGLADSIDSPEKNATNRFDFNIYNHVKQIPDAVLQAWGKPNQSTPEPSPRGEESPAVTPQKGSAMSDTTVTPAAPAPPAVTAQTPPSTIERLTAETISGHRASARTEGLTEGIQQERDRMKAIMAACPNDPQMAVDTFIAGYDPLSVKLAYDRSEKLVAKAQADAATQQEKDKMEILRLNALAVSGGHRDVAMNPSGDDDTNLLGMAPKQQAEWEWDNRPSVRKTASSKEIYVLAREAELSGTHRSFSREPAQS